MKQFFLACSLLIILSSSVAFAQKTAAGPQVDPRTTPAYSLLIQRKSKGPGRT
jgi:hypothetical protein